MASAMLVFEHVVQHRYALLCHLPQALPHKVERCRPGQSTGDVGTVGHTCRDSHHIVNGYVRRSHVVLYELCIPYVIGDAMVQINE